MVHVVDLFCFCFLYIVVDIRPPYELPISLDIIIGRII
jgi:hypothetical protein